MKPYDPPTIGAHQSLARLIAEHWGDHGPDHVYAIAIEAQPGEPLAETLYAAWHAIRLGNHKPPNWLPVDEAEDILAAQNRSVVVDHISVSDVDEIVSQFRGLAGSRDGGIVFERLPTGHDIVFMVIAAAAQATAASVSLTVIRKEIKALMLKPRIKRLSDNYQEAIEFAQRIALERFSGSWIVLSSELDADSGELKVRLTHEEDQALPTEEARSITLGIIAIGARFDYKVMATNRVP